MSARVIQGGPSVQPAVCQLPPEPEVATPSAPEVCRATRDQIEQFRATENDARAGAVGRALEQWFEHQLAGVPEGGKRELELSVEGGEEIVGSGKVKLAVEQQGGQYLVTVEGAAAVGAGGLAKDTKAKATAGLEGSATFRFGSAKEAADALSAIVQSAPESGIGGPGGQLLGRLVRDDDALARALGAMGRLQSVELGSHLRGELQVKDVKPTLDLGIDWTAGGVKLDLSKRELLFSTSLGGEVSGKLSSELASGELKGSSELVGLRGTVSLEQHFPLSLQDVDRIQKGGLAALKEIAKDSARHSRTEAVVRLEGSVGGLGMEAERRGSPAELLRAVLEGNVLQSNDWSFQGFKPGAEVSTELDAGALKLEATAKDTQQVLAARGELAPLVRQGAIQARDAQRQARALSAHRALSMH